MLSFNHIVIRDKIYLFGFLFLVVGLSFSRAFVSLSYVLLIGNWLLDPRVFKKFGIFFRNKSAVIFTSIYLLHLLGLLYTSDFEYGWLETRTKVPLLIFPLIFSTIPTLPKRDFKAILLVFSFAVVASFSTALFWLFTYSPVDFRDAFRFVSHIRLSLMAVFAIAVFTWLSFSSDHNSPLWQKCIFVGSSLFLIASIFILEVGSGMVLLILAFCFVSIYYLLIQKGKFANILKIVFPIVLISSAILIFSTVYHYRFDANTIEYSHTRSGNLYLQHANYYPIENGSAIGRNICWQEMESAWSKVSSIHIDSADGQGNKLRFTLLRYLNSKHLTKDMDGVMELGSQDIQFIEKGFANVEYTKKFSYKKRVYKLLWEYDLLKNNGNINSSSALKRFYLWIAGVEIIKHKPIFGVGTGDVKHEFANELERVKSPLASEGLRAHNQFITIGVAFGILGLLWFVFAFFYPFFALNKPHFLLVAFFTIYSLSMLWEDSLETQIGVTIIAFLYPLLLFSNPYFKSNIDLKKNEI